MKHTRGKKDSFTLRVVGGDLGGNLDLGSWTAETFAPYGSCGAPRRKARSTPPLGYTRSRMEQASVPAALRYVSEREPGRGCSPVRRPRLVERVVSSCTAFKSKRRKVLVRLVVIRSEV